MIRGSYWEDPKEYAKLLDKLNIKVPNVPNISNEEQIGLDENELEELERAYELELLEMREKEAQWVPINELKAKKVATKRDQSMKPERDPAIDSGPKDVHLREKILPKYVVKEVFYTPNRERVPGVKGPRKSLDIKGKAKAKFIVKERILRIDEETSQVFKSITTSEG